jgi:hypothetical protein
VMLFRSPIKSMLPRPMTSPDALRRTAAGDHHGCGLGWLDGAVFGDTESQRDSGVSIVSMDSGEPQEPCLGVDSVREEVHHGLSGR